MQQKTLKLHPDSPRKNIMLVDRPAVLALQIMARQWGNMLVNQGFFPRDKPIIAQLILLNKERNVPMHIVERQKEPFKSQAFCDARWPHLWVVFHFKRGTSVKVKLPQDAMLLTLDLTPYGKSMMWPAGGQTSAGVREIVAKNGRGKAPDWFMPELRRRLWPELEWLKKMTEAEKSALRN